MSAGESEPAGGPAYVDTSCLVCIAFDEPGGRELADRLGGHGRLVSANLLEAEFRAAMVREEVGGGEGLLEAMSWVLPHRPLRPEIEAALSAGYLRGADLWHVATALYVAELPSELPFFTLDERQRRIAGELGFPTPI